MLAASTRSYRNGLPVYFILCYDLYIDELFSIEIQQQQLPMLASELQCLKYTIIIYSEKVSIISNKNILRK